MCTAHVDGVPMKKLSKVDRLTILPQLRAYIEREISGNQVADFPHVVKLVKDVWAQLAIAGSEMTEAAKSCMPSQPLISQCTGEEVEGLSQL